jgi:DNA-directed RNA polymerase subunit omega
MNDLLKKVGNRYLLVNIAAHRAREIAEEAEAQEYALEDKPVTLALYDILDGRVVADADADGNPIAPAKNQYDFPGGETDETPQSLASESV